MKKTMIIYEFFGFAQYDADIITIICATLKKNPHDQFVHLFFALPHVSCTSHKMTISLQINKKKIKREKKNNENSISYMSMIIF